VVASLMILLLIAVAGCGSEKAEQASAGSESTESTQTAQSTDGSSTQAMVAATTPESGTLATRRARKGTIHRITLTDKRCIRFEPQWTDVRMGQSVTWHSELKSPLTIYVSPGVFSRESYLVRPGATVSTGPALSAGRYSFWTEPSACREAPRGVLMAGPGVRVQETYYASTGPR
jgi:plastocyanin